MLEWSALTRLVLGYEGLNVKRLTQHMLHAKEHYNDPAYESSTVITVNDKTTSRINGLELVFQSGRQDISKLAAALDRSAFKHLFVMQRPTCLQL